MGISKPKIIVICGPTGIGKTEIAIEMARRFHGEIINADSMQIYRYMDIGTAKPTPAQRDIVPHHLIDIINPDQSFDAAKFAQTAHEKIITLYSKNIIPLIVGGTGFYIKALLHGLCQPKPIDESVRKHLKETAETKGTAFLYECLCRYDSDKSKQLHPNDTYRIIRALEVYETSGKSISDYQQEHRFSEQFYNVLKIGIDMDRAKLYDRINCRVDKMIQTGFLEEVTHLLKMGYTPALKSMQSIGYRHLIEYIEQKMPWDETVRILKRDTRRYAKRQWTWFKADSENLWFLPEQLENIYHHMENFLHANA